MGALGLTREDYDEDDVVPIWPDNWEPVIFFKRDLMGQWRLGPGGAVGLDYNVLPFLLRLRRIPRSQWEDVIDAVQIMEDEALRVFAEQSKQQ